MSDFPTQAQVVIIGGGVGGASIAYHLTKLGWKDVVIIEKHELTSGSTWHSAGLVGQMRSDANLTRMMHYSTDLYRSLKAETGQDTSWREVGGIRLASSAERMEENKRLVGMARSFGVPMELISPKEAQNMFPLMDITGVVGAAYTPNDGSIDPTGLTNALAIGAKNRGAKIFTNTTVTAINVKNGRVHEVVTDKGTIKTEVVVNASGMWGREIGKMVGLSLPVLPMAHLYIMTKPIEGVTNTFPNLRDPDLLVYWREEVGGLVTGGYERQPATFGMNGIPKDFKFQLLPPDWERFTPLMENSIRRVPAVETAEVKMLLNGPEGFTPDGEFLLGPTSVKGFWVACAFCAHGLAGAGGIGKVMAEWIVDGNPEWDMWRLDVRRFGPNYNNLDYVAARTFETYTQYYDIHYPGEERISRRNVRTSPTYFRLRDLGCSFGEKMGWERPNWYRIYEEKATHGHEPKGWMRHNWSRAIGHEHLMTRENAGLFDETSFNKFEVRGPGALKFLNYVCSNQIDVPVGNLVYTQCLNKRGGIECDFTVTRLAEDRFFIVTGTAFGQHDMSWLSLQMPEDGSVTLEDVGSSMVCIGMWGPKARTILEKVTTEDVSNAGFPYMTSKRINVGDVPVLASRVTYVGELGWEFYCASEYGLRLWDTLWEAGQSEGMVAGGYKAIDTLRLEKGYRYWSGEISPDYTPYEAGLGFAVKLDKENFIGKDALVKQKAEGIKRKLCTITLDDDRTIVIGKEPIRVGDKLVGWVASGGFGYSINKSIAYAYLPMEFAKAGTKLSVECFGEQVSAEVAQAVLWDPKAERVRQ
ncbi:MAG: FAD-dependent oxidoreductase [Anaerolineales bacterium]|uniref:GcvT family protein n=1 Tax=Candidatus Villigracilis affinis TaxID=3140682 RepID=UPI002A191CA4|nr:FAD-dependent oxidoreductase [Anaerolineales bacterium]MBL0345085.1 FAD-dependent oxidoreductase [Anaerolineales bacterium]